MSEAIAIAPVAPRRRRFRLKHVAASLIVVALVATGAFTAWVISLGPLPLAEARQISTTVVDRNGKLLRAYAMADGR